MRSLTGKNAPFDRPLTPDAMSARASIHGAHCAEFTIVPVRLLLTTIGISSARRLCPLDMNLLQRPNSPGTEELPR